MRRVTIGIPSYNEERNIINLLQSIENQQALVSEVIISDDSIDRTPSLILDYAKRSSLNIILFHHEKRRGAAAAWNEIFRNSNGETILLYDADTIPHPSCTEILSSSISARTALCASNSIPVKEKNVAGRATAFVSSWLRSVRKARLSQYTVMGRALAIDSAIGSKIEIPLDTIAIDLYLQCKVLEMGFNVGYNDEAIVYFKSPSTTRDMTSQVVRAANGHNQIKEMVSRLGIGLPPHIAIGQALKNVLRDPLGAASTIMAYSMIPFYRSKIESIDSARWDVADSSKTIDYQQLKARF